MKKKALKRTGCLVLSSVLAMSSLFTGMTAMAGPMSEEFLGDGARAKAQPHFSGYRVLQMKNWSEETDPYADMMRARVPLQERNEAFAATQANPELASDAEVMLMQGDYGNSGFNSTLYNNRFSEHCLNFWQYVDYFSPWHGAETVGTPTQPDDPIVKDTTGRDFEYGLLNIPNPAYTNAAHKNGVKAIAGMFLPRTGQPSADLLEQAEDGSFPVADKLIEMANYYGYDGYFFNQEESIPSENVKLYKQFTKYLRDHGMYVQWYDSILPSGGLAYQNAINENSAAFIHDETYGLGKVNDSIFLNYWWTSPYNIESSLEYAAEHNIDPFKEVFFGMECNQNEFNGGNSSASEVDLLYAPGTKNLRSSVALFTPSDYYQRGLDDDLSISAGEIPLFQQKEYQWMIDERERMFFSGVMEDPTDTGKKDGYSREDVGVRNASGWGGVADFASERSVINGTIFHTEFNTGHGMQYFQDGEVSNSNEWTNINLQNIMPSWQWWVDSEGSKLDVDFDYGPTYVRNDVDGNPIEAPFTQIGAYDGGSSLAVHGTLDAENFLHLYKTDLSVTDSTSLSVTYNKTSETDDSKMELGVIFKSSPETVVTFHVPSANQKTDGWVTKQISLGDYAGEEIAAMGLVFQNGGTAIENYQMNIGALSVTDGQSYTPEAPTGLKVDTAYDTKEMVIRWDLGDYNTVDRYHVYATLSNGQRMFMGGIYDDVYYIKSTYGEEDVVKVEVTAVGKDGSESQPVSTEYRYSDKVSNISVAQEVSPSGMVMEAEHAGYLDVSWENPNVEYKELNLSVSPLYTGEDTAYTMTVPAGETSARIMVPRGHGEHYNLSISTVFEDGTESEPILYKGKLKDVYSDPIDPACVVLDGNEVSFRCLYAQDWWKMTGYVDGEEVFHYIRNIAGQGHIERGVQLPGEEGVLEIVVEDYTGIKSEPAYFHYGGKSADVEVNEDTFPDPVLLEAVKTQIGETAEDLANFDGTLDLSNLDIQDYTGLNQIKAKEINLTGSNLTDIKPGTFDISVEKINLTDSKGLANIYPDSFAGSDTREINLTGCDALQIIGLNDSNLEIVTCEDPSILTNVVHADLSGSRFDLSEGTPEKAFVDALTEIASDKEDIVVADPQGKNLALGADIVEEQTTINHYNAPKVVDGNKDQYITFYEGSMVTIDLGSEQSILSWTLINDTSSYGLSDFEIKGSNDKENYTTIVSVTDNEEVEVSGEIKSPAPYRYYQLIGTETFSSGGDIRELELNGYATIVYEAGVQSDNQRPRVVPAEMETTVQVEKQNGQEIDLQEILTEAKQTAENNATSVRGNTVEELKDAAWLDPDYELAAEDQIDREVHVIKVTDRDGNVSYDTVLDQSVDNIYTVDYITYNSANVEGENLYTFTVNVKGVTSVLERVIEIAEQMVADGALDNTMEAVVAEFNAALQAAKDLVAQEYASQEDLNAAAVRLVKVMGKVDWKQGDKTVLEVAVDVANAINENLDQYEEAGKQEFIDALANAQTILASGNAWQEDVDAAYDALMEAMTNLRMTPNKDILNEMINEASGLDLSTYTEDSAAALNEALANAKAVAANENATQTEVDAAADTLEAAMSGLVLVNDDENQAAEGNTTGTDTTTPVGEGTTPTKTGDAGVAGLVMLAAISAAGTAFILGKKSKN